MAYPSNRYPDDPDFPAATNRQGFDVALYDVITAYITDITAEMSAVFDNDGNIALAADKTIKWGGVSYLAWSSSKVQAAALEIPDGWTYGTLAVGGDMTTSGDLTIGSGGTMTLSGDLDVTGQIDVDIISGTLELAQVAEPDDPESRASVLWCSNGTGAGDAGDIMIKLNHDGTVKTTTLVDHS